MFEGYFILIMNNITTSGYAIDIGIFCDKVLNSNLSLNDVVVTVQNVGIVVRFLSRYNFLNLILTV